MQNKDMIIKILLEANDINNFSLIQSREMIKKLEKRITYLEHLRKEEIINTVIKRCPEECKELFDGYSKIDISTENFLIYYKDSYIFIPLKYSSNKRPYTTPYRKSYSEMLMEKVRLLLMPLIQEVYEQIMKKYDE